MKILLSPAKTFAKKITIPEGVKPTDKCLFQADTETLVAGLQSWEPGDYSKTMGVSENLAHLNHERYQDWKHQEKALALAYFKGDVYKGLVVEDFTSEDWEYAQDYVHILSGLYGLLRAHDEIRNHRLEMGTSWEPESEKNLYAFWGDKIALALNEVESEVVVNLASAEYFKSVDRAVLKAPVITPVFKEHKNSAYKVIAIHAKKARGLMARYAVKNKITNVEDLKNFDLLDYRFIPELSTDKAWVFGR